jgi:hypothetical protein
VKKQLALNTLTTLATIAILAAIALGAYTVTAHGTTGKADQPLPRLLGRRMFGVAADPWHVRGVTLAIGRRFDIVMSFASWSRRSDPSASFAEAARNGLVPMVTWEPWRPGVSAPRPGAYRAIAGGRYDSYIRMYARACAAYGGTILLRYAPGMNDRWDPWPTPAGEYVAAWRHVVRVFRSVRATNVLFVFSVNPSLYVRSPAGWLRRVRTFWPGSSYVGWVGATMIDFGGTHEYGVRALATRLGLLRSFGKPVMVSEANVNFRMRYRWMRAFRAWLERAGWVRAVVWSQAQGHARSQLPRIGDMRWRLADDPRAAALLRGIMQATAYSRAPRSTGTSPGGGTPGATRRMSRFASRAPCAPRTTRARGCPGTRSGPLPRPT